MSNQATFIQSGFTPVEHQVLTATYVVEQGVVNLLVRARGIHALVGVRIGQAWYELGGRLHFELEPFTQSVPADAIAIK